MSAETYIFEDNFKPIFDVLVEHDNGFLSQYITSMKLIFNTISIL
jgi:hypothetical protein